jgi:hypothetical protein
VETIDVDMKNERVIVVGSVDPKLLVKRLAKVGKKVEIPGSRGGKGGGDHSHSHGNAYHHHDANEHGSMGAMVMMNNPFGFKGKGKNRNGLRGRVAAASGDSDGDDDDDVGSNGIIAHPESYAHLFSDENANSCVVM